MTVLAKMQPYLFPYIGYYQLIRAADIFIASTRLAYIKKGWINRNRLKYGTQARLFTVPLKKWHHGQRIDHVMVYEDGYRKWRNSFFKTMQTHYSKAPYYKDVTKILESVFSKNGNGPICDFALKSLVKTIDYLGIDTRMVLSSEKYDDIHMEKQERIIHTCRIEKADVYINLPGGAVLYSKKELKEAGIKIYFIQPKFTEYTQQGKGPFIEGLSIIDVLMNNSVKEVHQLLDNHTFV